jgi:hypothetical protein
MQWNIWAKMWIYDSLHNLPEVNYSFLCHLKTSFKLKVYGRIIVDKEFYMKWTGMILSFFNKLS